MTSLRRISAICANVLMTLQTVCRCSSRKCAKGRGAAAGDGVVLWWWRSEVGKGGKLRRVVEADSYRLCGLCLLSRPRLKLHTLDLSRPLGVLPSLDTVRY